MEFVGVESFDVKVRNRSVPAVVRMVFTRWQDEKVQKCEEIEVGALFGATTKAVLSGILKNYQNN